MTTSTTPQTEADRATGPDMSAVAAVAVTVVCWASAFVAIRAVGRSSIPVR